MTLLALGALLVAQAGSPSSDDPRRLSLAVVPVGFADVAVSDEGPREPFTGRLPDWFRRVSGGRLELMCDIREGIRLAIPRERFRDRHLVDAALDDALAGFDAVVFILAGPLGDRGTPLWPHRDLIRSGSRRVEYAVLVEKPGDRALGIAAHEIAHLLGLRDKYNDAKASVGAWCLMGTGYDAEVPAPPCAACRMALGWTRPREVDSRKAVDVELGADPGETVRIRVARSLGESLLLELRDRLLVWHVQTGGRISLLGVYPDGERDRITPYSDPPFRPRSIGSWSVYLTGIRIADGRARLRVGPSAPLTEEEQKRRASVSRPIGN